jgi:deazaflavin-dependent oxidoreductase (nitroreductase family)
MSEKHEATPTGGTTPTTASEKAPPQVPRWLVRTIWAAHRTAYRLTAGRFGLRAPAANRWGMLRLTTTGRRSGRTRVAILGYLEDGERLLIPAMNGWADPEPAWWLNLQATPHAHVVLPGGVRREVAARAAVGEERDRLWRRFVGLGTLAYTDASAAQRARETAIVVLEPIDA